jgi:hypothetical protein
MSELPDIPAAVMEAAVSSLMRERPTTFEDG